MKRKLMTLFMMTCLGIACWAQSSATQPSTIFNNDGTVTFQFKNDKAKSVQVDVQFAGRHDMKKDAKTGLWTVTLGPAAPDMYPYCFVVDGVSVMDPQCDQYFPNEGFKNSLLDIPAKTGSLAHDIKDVPHGSVNYIHYYSKSLGATNQAIVYLPPGYMRNRDQKYPVFYLISGTTDTEEVYYKVGRMNYILDNLLAEGKAKEMIIVLPYGNPSKLLSTVPAEAGVPQMRFGGDVFTKDVINDLMPYVEQHYRTINDRDHRAIGGFSRGGNQGLMIGLTNLDKFSYLCSYSSFTSTTLPGGVYDNADDTNSKIHLFWLGVGTDDFLFGTARDYMEHLDKKGIRSVKEFTHDKFGHTWMNAKYFLTKTMPLLFNPEASKAALKDSQPTPVATGNEQQLTPAVMGRLFPRPITSPDYQKDGIIFRFKAENAQQVTFCAEIFDKPLPMTKDADGVWSIELKKEQSANLFEPFTYYFSVDGMAVADPNDMYLAPVKGFKPSIANHPSNEYNFAAMGDIPHGTVSYSRNRATYIPATADRSERPAFIRLVPGKDDTVESWFKIGGADAVVDKLVADKKIKPVMIMIGEMRQGGQQGMGEVPTLKADDFKTWPERRKALIKMLESL
ncbi:MAG: hypothetical protein IK148_06360 [Prevotella sp.]|nr:hypothetical protein [Prevotella sp.]